MYTSRLSAAVVSYAVRISAYVIPPATNTSSLSLVAAP